MATSTIERAICYLRKLPPACSGQGGHATTYAAAQALVRGFALDESTALRLLEEVHNPTCSPPWSKRELQHKVQSAAKDSRREPGYLLEPAERNRDHASAREPAVPTLDAASYHNVASRLIELCPVVDDSEVADYCDRRCLIIAGAHARLGGLPPKERQGAVVEALCKNFEVETLARAGLLRRYDDGNLETRWLWSPRHRLVIPWRSLDGSITVLQRRVLDDSTPKYVFPKGRKPLYPFGAERLRATDASWPVVFCEGALDVLALRLIARRDATPIVALGLPGLDGWRAEWARWAQGREARIAVDTDDKGEKFVRRMAEDLWRAGASRVRRWRPPNGAKDWMESLPGRAK